MATKTKAPAKAKAKAKAKLAAKAKPVGKKAPAKAKPVGKKAPAKAKPVGKKAPAKAKPVAKKPAAKAKPVAKKAPVKSGAKTKPFAKVTPPPTAGHEAKAAHEHGTAAPHVHHEPPPIIGVPSPAALRARLLVDGERFGEATLALQPMPPLRLTSGVLVACDPFEVHGPALGRRLKPGSYNVAAAVATYPDHHGPGEQILAAVVVKLSAARPTRWEQAAFADDGFSADPAYHTDSGVGCFMDAKLQALLVAEPTTFPTASFRALERQLLDEHHVATWGWATYQPEATAPATCVAFLGGAAPVRRSYWGFDERGQLACLLTDLESLPATAWQ